MRLSARTLEILMNFASINPSILLRRGDTQTTVATNRTMMARAVFDEHFPEDIPLFSIARFLSVYKLLSEPEIEFHGTHMLVRDRKSNSSFRYVYADPSIITTPQRTDIEVTGRKAKFVLEPHDIKRIMSAMSALSTPDVVFVAENGNLHLETCDMRTQNKGDIFRIQLTAELPSSANFRAVFNAERFKLLEMPYEVYLDENIAKFVGNRVNYWIALDHNSTWS